MKNKLQFCSHFLIPGHIAIPDFSAAGMENWGLISYKEGSLLIDPVSGTASERQGINGVVAHEVAHQVSWYIWKSQTKGIFLLWWQWWF